MAEIKAAKKAEKKNYGSYMKVKCRKVKVDILAFCASLLSFCQQAEEERVIS